MSQIVSHMPEPVHARAKLGSEPSGALSRQAGLLTAYVNQQKNENTMFLSRPVLLILSLSFDKEDMYVFVMRMR